MSTRKSAPRMSTGGKPPTKRTVKSSDADMDEYVLISSIYLTSDVPGPRPTVLLLVLAEQLNRLQKSWPLLMNWRMNIRMEPLRQKRKTIATSSSLNSEFSMIFKHCRQTND